MTLLDFREISVKVQDVFLPQNFMQTATELLAIKIGLGKLNPAMILNILKELQRKNYIIIMVVKFTLMAQESPSILSSEANTENHINLF